MTEQVTALDFGWGAAPPQAPPFVAQWSGSLVVPTSGDYLLAVEGGGPQSTLTLTVDDILLLDTGLNLLQQQMPFAQGVHRLELTYRSGDQSGDLRITWQPPGETAQTLAAPFLHSPALPDQGLLGDYYGNDQFMPPVVAANRDPIIGLDPGLPLPYSVIWQGLIAAPRAGEYLIAFVSRFEKTCRSLFRSPFTIQCTSSGPPSRRIGSRSGSSGRRPASSPPWNTCSGSTPVSGR